MDEHAPARIVIFGSSWSIRLLELLNFGRLTIEGSLSNRPQVTHEDGPVRLFMRKEEVPWSELVKQIRLHTGATHHREGKDYAT